MRLRFEARGLMGDIDTAGTGQFEDRGILMSRQNRQLWTETLWLRFRVL